MKKNGLILAALAAAVVLVGMACGGAGGSGVSCTEGTGSNLACVEYSWTAGMDLWSAACTQAGGTAGTGCSHVGALGGCKITSGTAASSVSSTVWYYSASTSSSASQLQTACTAASGTWITP